MGKSARNAWPSRRTSCPSWPTSSAPIISAATATASSRRRRSTGWRDLPAQMQDRMIREMLALSDTSPRPSALA